MSNRWPGGLIRKTPVTPTASSAVGVWTLAEAMYWTKQGQWPTPGDPDFDYVSLLLPGNGTNGAQNNTFLDSSANNFTITRNGDTTQGSFSPYGDLWSNYFDGAGDYLTLAYNTAFNVPGDFTIEAWVYQTARGANSQTVVNRSGISNVQYSSFELIVQANGTVVFQQGSGTGASGSQIALTSTAAIPLNAWTHIAGVKNGSTSTLYVNGVQAATGAAASNDGNTTSGIFIGARSTTDLLFTGYINGVRLIKGTALYTSNFTPPTAPLTAVSGTSLLTCQSNRFRDASSNNFAITRNGDVRVTNFAPFNPTAAYDPATNGGSGYFDGSGDYLTINGSTAVNFGTGNFTVELWVYTANSGTLLDGASGVQNAINIGIDAVTKQVIFFSSTTPRIYGDGFTPNAWQHIALTRSGTSTRLFLNGIQAGGTFTDSSSYVSGTNRPIIGNSTYVNSPLLGYISNLRVVKGTALYTSNFTPPTAPVTAITNTSLLLNFTNAGIVDASAKNDLVTVGNAQISTAQSKFGGSSIAFDGAGDRLISPPNIAMDLSSGDFTIECWIYSNNISSVPTICYRGDSAPLTSTSQLQWQIIRNGSTITFLAYFGGSSQNLSLGTIAASTWYHIAVTRSGSIFRGFLNGVQAAGTINTTATLNNNTAWPGIVVGLRIDQGVDWPWNGYIDDLRITKGVARYTANFTPPTAPFLLK